MTPDFDVIIVGSGPAGVSAAFPLVSAGLRVLMVDGGKQAQDPPPTEDFLSWRTNDTFQARRMVGEKFHALKMLEAVSPKLRIPSLAYVFDQFMEKNRISGENFTTIGSLATGGLSNAWGCGVARFSSAELESFPFSSSEIESSYAAVAKRIGISGGISDDLSEYYGLDEWSQLPIAMDKMHDYFLQRYNQSREKLVQRGFKMGRTRLAVLNEDHNGRQACSLSGNCLWGCHRRALYSAIDELPSLKRYENFRLEAGFLVSGLSQKEGLWSIEGKAISVGECRSISATKIILAAGTLTTTRLVLQTLGHYEARPLLSCPTAAFMIWLPHFLGAKRESAFGLGQLSFTLSLGDRLSAFGATFSTTGVPMSEFVRHVPLKTRYGVDLLKSLLSSCVVGNMFLPGAYGGGRAKISADGQLVVSCTPHDETEGLLKKGAHILSKSYRTMGAVLLPGSFTTGRAGGDIHYSGTLPMRKTPKIGETGPIGEVISLDGIHVVDGASLSILPEKPHTLTIMANADRIAHKIVDELKAPK
jgi:choline dehydrogenase-like flavoprotein